MTFETLRSYFSVNASGQLSILYKFVFSCLYPLQSVFDNYDSFRIKKQIIASCKWQIGQLTNVLNYFFDPTLKRIYINQSEVTVIADPTFDYDPVSFDPVFDETTTIFEPVFSGLSSKTNATIMVPVSVFSTSENEIISVLEQVKMNGIPYQINTF